MNSKEVRCCMMGLSFYFTAMLVIEWLGFDLSPQTSLLCRMQSIVIIAWAEKPFVQFENALPLRSREGEGESGLTVKGPTKVEWVVEEKRNQLNILPLFCCHFYFLDCCGYFWTPHKPTVSASAATVRVFVLTTKFLE